MEQYQIYLFIFLGLLIGTRMFTNRQFYKLSDEDKLKLIGLNRSVATISYIFYGALLALYLLAIYACGVDAILATRVLIICFSVYLVIFSIRSFRRLKAEHIVIPYYTALLFVRLAIYAVFFCGVFFYFHEQEKHMFSDDAYQLLEEARDKWKKGDNKAAVEICNSLIRNDSTVSGYFMYRGVYRFNAGDQTGAVVDWQRCVSMGDTTAQCYLRGVSRSQGNYLERAEQSWKSGDYKTAVMLCDTLILKDSAVSVYYLNRGVYKYNGGDFDGADLDWKHALAMGDTTALRYLRSHPKQLPH